jgi:hypothetical protein
MAGWARWEWKWPFAVLALTLSGCNTAPPESSNKRRAEAESPQKPLSPTRTLATPELSPAAGASPGVDGASPARADAPQPLEGRLIAIGDVHGDLAATRAALRLGGAIDADDRWIGAGLTVVQTGDQLDRGDDERQIVDLLSRLAEDAAKSGGRVVALNGNHEIMNVQGDFRYVTPGAVTSFDGVTPRSPHARTASPPFQERAAAFLPGGAYALELSERDVIAVVGDSVFVHGGVLPEHVRYGIERINRETREWMRSGDRVAPVSVANERAPVWMRDYSIDPVPEQTCAVLGEVLGMLRVRRMVVGHTTQRNGITSACGDRVYRIDVGLSRYYGDGPIQVLEISEGQVRTLSAPRG